MINKFEFFHGTVLSRLIHRTEGVSIRKYSEKDNASYVINGHIGMYVKYSTKRLTPWGYTFALEHLNVLTEMVESFQNVFIVLVCNEDGVCCLSYKEFLSVVGENNCTIERKWVTIERNKREEYLVKGTTAQLPYKISDSHFPMKLFTSCSDQKQFV